MDRAAELGKMHISRRAQVIFHITRSLRTVEDGKTIRKTERMYLSVETRTVKGNRI